VIRRTFVEGRLDCVLASRQPLASYDRKDRFQVVQMLPIGKVFGHGTNGKSITMSNFSMSPGYLPHG